MQKDFELETILTVTTGINLTDDFSNVFEMAYFIYNNDKIGTVNLRGMRAHMRKHILSIYPELENIKLNFSCFTMNKWLDEQKKKYGEVLPIPRYRESLDKDTRLIKRKEPTNNS